MGPVEYLIVLFGRDAFQLIAKLLNERNYKMSAAGQESNAIMLLAPPASPILSNLKPRQADIEKTCLEGMRTRSACWHLGRSRFV
jgi:hypothetical protein